MGKKDDIKPAPDANAPPDKEPWLTPERYRRLGKYMKPWGKPPTGATFWIQLITTAAVIIISIFKGVDSSVELVISYGVPEYQQRQEPQSLAFGIIFLLTCFVVIVGYLWYWIQARQLAAQEAAEQKALAAEMEASKEKAAKAKAEAAAGRPMAAASEPTVADGSKGSTGGERSVMEEQLRQLEAQGQMALQQAVQRMVMEGRAAGKGDAELNEQLQALKQSHAQHMNKQKQMVVEMEQVRQAALAEGLSPEEAARRAAAIGEQHKHKQQLEAKHHNALRRVHQEALTAKVTDAEMSRRLEAQQKINSLELAHEEALQEMAAETGQRGEKEGLPPEEVMARIKAVVQEEREHWKQQHTELTAAEQAMRKDVEEMAKQREDDSLDPEIKEMLQARVRVSGLQARPELNGQLGTVTRYVKDKGRFAVTVENPEKGIASDQLLLKPANLSIVAKVGADGNEVDDEAAPPPLE